MDEKIKLIDQDNNSGRVASYVPFYDDRQIKIYNGNFESVLPQLTDKIDVIITDPPYPDYYEDEYRYYDGILSFLAAFDCRQLIFWSVREPFPLDHTAIHIWDKARGVGTMYERIFERNGGIAHKVYRHQKYNNQLDATINRDILTGHKSQKPIKLIANLIKDFTKEGDTILDTFMGSGTTLAAAKKMGRKAIGIEIETKWCEVAAKRINEYSLFE